VHTAGDLKTVGTLAEARNNGNLLSAWKANDSSNQVWLSYNNGSPFTISPTTKTFVSPAVVAVGPTNFLVFHTGIDGQIWYAAVAGTNHATGWIPVPGQTSNMSVSVAQIGGNSRNVYMVYRGSGNDKRVFGTWMNEQQEWSSPIILGGGLAVTASAICLNNTGSSLWVATIGLDNQLWTTSQPLGAASWPNWTPRGVFTGRDPDHDHPILAPSCAATNNGNVALAYVDKGSHPNYAVFNNGGGLVSQWSEDLVSLFHGWQTDNAVQLTSAGNTVWSLFTGIGEICSGGGECNDNDVYWKQVYVAP
jgi:hypothetical protein